jgi:hypothetical protein
MINKTFAEASWKNGKDILSLGCQQQAFEYMTFAVLSASCVQTSSKILIQQFASKHKPQTFSRVCLRLKRGVYRWKLKCFTAHVTCHIEKP